MISYNTAYRRANENDAEACWLLFHLYYSGKTPGIMEVIDTDKEQAAHWLKKAAEAGHAIAQVNLAFIYFNVKKDNAEGLKWLQLAAKNGLPEAQASLGTCYMKGTYCEASMIDAIFWLTKASKEKLSSAQYNLGMLYYFGENKVKDYKQAYIWLYAAIQNNDPNSEHAAKVLEEIKRESGFKKNQIDMLNYESSDWYC